MFTSLFRIVMLLLVAIASQRFYTAEVFTAMSDMEELLDVEAVIINSLRSYVTDNEEKLNHLKRLVSLQKKHHKAFRNETSNGMSSYLLVKRLTSDLAFVESMVKINISSGILKNINMQRDKMKFPSDDDLNAVTTALIRLQKMYNLNTSSVARGVINGIQYSSKMTKHDCFEVGRQSYYDEDYDYAEQWMMEAMNKFDHSLDEFRNVSEDDILEYYILALFKQDKIRIADEFLRKVFEASPNNKKVINLYEFLLKEKTKKMIKEIQGDEALVKLCRGDAHREPKELSKLKCRYETNNVPFLKIAPVKVEVVNLDPYIVVFHDVLYDREIEEIKHVAKSRLNVSKVANKLLPSSVIRLSKVAWLASEDVQSIQNIDRRIEDMTGLSITTRERLQVANYGIGGYYVPHADYFGQEKHPQGGDRIATVLFYMADVDQGGATVFIDLKVSVRPKRGSALFWYNLHASGEADPRTLHAACPVLVGSKWAINIWLHERDQEFRRPCPLEPDHFYC